MTEHRPLHILLVHVWYYPHVGGGNQHVEQIGMELVRRGHKVTVWCADVPEHEESRFNRGGIDVIRIKPSRVLAGVDPVVSINDLSLDGVDLIHLHDTLPILIRKTLKRARKEKIPVVTTYHNDYIKHGLIANSIKSIRWSMQGKKTLHSSNARIVLTDYFEKLLRSKGVKGHIDVIPNGFSAIDEDAERPSALGELGDRKLLTFVGRLSEQKGLDVLMDAWDFLAEKSDPGFDLAIAGKGELGDWLTERIEKSPQNQAIHRLGLVSEGEKRWLLENSTGIVIPSRFEGLPTVMLEAMYANAPVIMADVNDLGRLVTEPNAGFSVEAGNSIQLASAMTQLISSSHEELENLGNAGNKASKSYMWPVISKDVLAVYRRVLEESN